VLVILTDMSSYADALREVLNALCSVSVFSQIIVLPFPNTCFVYKVNS
jgi:hypothetical protein